MSLRNEPEALQSLNGADAVSDEITNANAITALASRASAARETRDETLPAIDDDRAWGDRRLSPMRDIANVFAYPELRRALAAYAVLQLGLLGAALWLTSVTYVASLVAVAWLLFPPTEYLVHRYVLHPLIYLDTRISARFWIRVHFAHHSQPSRTDVILASPITVVMLAIVLNIPVALAAGPAAVVGGTFAILLPFMFYEFVHFSIHAPVEPASRYLRNRQRLHLLHHFHNEKRNFGICSSIVDKIVGTYANQIPDVERSGTARNLGYDEALASERPLVRIEYERRYLKN